MPIFEPMNFVHPWFLIALSALAIPLIIHLFSFRRYKRVFFPNVRFLKELKEETRSHSRLKHLLILLMRLLAISMLVLAFAQPFIPADERKQVTTGPQAIHVFIDNSFSMESRGSTGSLIEEAKRTATDIIKSYKASSQFQILTNDFEAKHQRYYSKEEALNIITAIKATPLSRTAEEITTRIKDLIYSRKVSEPSVFLISDFQSSSFDPDFFKSDTTLTLNLLPVTIDKAKNVFLDSCWFVDPVRRKGKREEIWVRIRNESTEELENVPLKLFINGQQKALNSFDLEAGQTKDTMLTYVSEQTGIHQGKIQLTDHPITFDDALFFSYKVLKNVNVLIANGKEENLFLNSLLRSDSSFRITVSEEKRLDYSRFNAYQLLILNEPENITSGLASELNKFMDNGGSVLVIPSPSSNGYPEFLSGFGIAVSPIDTARTRVTYLNSEHPLLSGVFEKKPENIDLPEVRKHFVIRGGSRSNFDPVMRLSDGSVFLGQSAKGKGKLYFIASPLREEHSTFVKHALFVPVIYNIALFSVPGSRLYFTAGRDEALIADTGNVHSEQVFRIKADTGKFEILPEHRRNETRSTLYLHNSIVHAGNYSLWLGEKRIQGCSFNYDRKESILNFLSKDELDDLAEKNRNIRIIDTAKAGATVSIEELSEGKRLWKYFIILTLIFILVEILIIKFWKNEAPVKVRTNS